MNAKQLYLYALGEATNVVKQVGPEHLELPTPCAEWTVHDLLQHITYELAWTADIVAGKTIAEVGDKYDGELLNGDLLETWQDYADAARDAVMECDLHTTAHLSYGDKPVGDYLLEAGNDQLVHAWDLGQAIGVDVQFDETAAQLLLERTQERSGELQASGLFDPPVKVAADAGIQTKLLALLGRSENWR